jgi:polyhydroxybutyrate depolymerase
LIATLACARTNREPGQTQPSIIITTPTDPATIHSPLPYGESEHTLTHNGRERTYLLYVPTSVDWNKPLPLVFVFHGGTGNGKSARAMSQFNDTAIQNGFIVVYADGTGRVSDSIGLTWNAGHCCGYARQENVDDVGFVRAMAAELEAQANIDTRRIYATGLSNGAMLSQRLACEAADLFAAVAPVAGTLNFEPCTPAQPISVIEFHGTADQHVLYEGGYGPQSLVDVNFTSVPETMQFWTTFNGCASTPVTESFSDIKHETWSGCAASTSVELYTILGGGHAWPGGRGGWPGADVPTQTISATQLIWAFFAAHPKP